MANSSDTGDQSIFEQLRSGSKTDILEQRAKEAQAELIARIQRDEQRLQDLILDNSSLPTTISSIRILGAPNTRNGFLKRIFDPIIRDANESSSTLYEVISGVTGGVNKLHKLDIFQAPIPIAISSPDSTDPSTTPTDIDITLQVKERKKLFLKAGTDVGNAEGSAYLQGLIRNMFGGAETLNVYAGLGTRTRSSYQATFDTPILSNPNLRFEIGGLVNAVDKPWANHEELSRGGWTKLKWALDNNSRHELAYNGSWRTVTGLGQDASPIVRGEAGDSAKSSISHVYLRDFRDNPLLPTRGYFGKSTLELAGWGPLAGDVGFGKAEVETQSAFPIPIPGIKGDSGVSFTTGLRAGLLYPLPLAHEAKARPSRINDRFQLGGPADVRGFRLSGLGPHDGKDAVGGDLYAAASANLLFPIPRVALDRPFRFQTFITGGRLLALKQPGKDTGRDQNVKDRFAETVSQLGDGLPSTSAGFGLVYAAPMARFELNFSLPLVTRKGEEGRKGLSFGIGINMF